MADVPKTKTLNVKAALQQLQPATQGKTVVPQTTEPVVDPWGNAEPINLDDFNEPSFLQKAGGFIGDMGERFAGGAASALSGIAKIPQAMDALSNLPYDMFSKAYIKKAGEDGTLTPEESAALLKNYDDYWLRPTASGVPTTKNNSPGVSLAHSKFTKGLDQFSENMQGKSNTLDESIWDYTKTGRIGKAVGKTVLGAIESLPATLTAAFTGPAGLIGMGFQAAAQQYDSLEDFSPEMGDPAKVANMVGYGLFESLTEVYGTAEIQKIVKEAIKTAGKQGAKEILRTGVDKVIRDAYKKIGLWLAPVHEGLSEGVNTFAGNAISIATGEKEATAANLGEGVFDAIAIGAATGFGFAGVGSIKEKMAAKQATSQPVTPGTTDQGTVNTNTGPLNVPPAVTDQYNAEQAGSPIQQTPEAIINSYGEKLKYYGGPIAGDPNPHIRIASTKQGGKYFIKKPAGVNGDEFHPAYDIEELKAADFDLSKVNPTFIKSSEITEQKEVPYQEWFTNEMNEYNNTQLQVQKDAATQQSPYQPGQSIEYRGRQWNVTDVGPDGTLSMEEISKDGTGTLAEITPDQFSNIIGDQGIQESGNTPQNESVSLINKGIQPSTDNLSAPAQVEKLKARKISDGKNELSMTPTEDGNFTIDQTFNTVEDVTNTQKKLQKLYPKVKFEVQETDSGDDFTPNEFKITATVAQAQAKPAGSPIVDAETGSSTISATQPGVALSDTPLADQAQVNISKNTPNINTPLANAVNEGKQKPMEKPIEVTDPVQVQAKITEIEAGPDYPQKRDDLAFYKNRLTIIEQSAPQGEAKAPVEDSPNLDRPKQPWEMTSKEYADQELTKLSEHAGPGSEERLRKEYLSAHKNRIVPVAIQQGHTIPDNVLAEYPELKHAPAEISSDLSQSKEHTAIIAANDQVDSNPSPAQIEVGNAKKGHVTVQGMDITIENAPGTIRKGKDWSQLMNNAYGYFRRTQGNDGDQVDVFLGDHPGSGWVFVVDQLNKEGNFDEHKVMMGFRSAKEATEAYNSNYQPDWKGLGSVTPMTIKQFKEWLGDGTRTKKPAYQPKPKPKKEPSRTAKAVNPEPNSFKEAILRFFVCGGKFKKADLVRYTGWSEGDLNPYRMWAFKNDGVPMDTFYEKLANDFGRGEDSHAMTNEIIEIMKDYPSFAKMLKALEQLQDPTQSHVFRSDINPADLEVALTDTDPGVVEVYEGIMANPLIRDLLLEYTDENGLDVDRLLEAIKFNPDGLTIFPLSEDELYDLKTYIENDNRGRKEKTDTGDNRPSGVASESAEQKPAGDIKQDEPRAEEAQGPTKDTSEVWQLTLQEFSDAVYRGEYEFTQLGQDKKPIQQSIASYHASTDPQNKQIAKEWIDKAIAQEHGPIVVHAIFEGEPVPANVVRESGVKKIPAPKDDLDKLNDILDGKPVNTPPPATKPGYGESNKVVTAAAAEEARRILREELGNLNMGVNPKVAIAGMTLAAYHIEAGARKFADYARAMVKDMGEKIKPYLKQFYVSVLFSPEYDTKGMDDVIEVGKADLDKILEEKKQDTEAFTKHMFSTVASKGEIIKQIEDNNQDPQNQRIAVRTKVKDLVSAFYVDHLPAIIKDYVSVELTDELFDSITDKILVKYESLNKKPDTFIKDHIIIGTIPKHDQKSPEDKQADAIPEAHKALIKEYADNMARSEIVYINETFTPHIGEESTFNTIKGVITQEKIDALVSTVQDRGNTVAQKYYDLVVSKSDYKRLLGFITNTANKSSRKLFEKITGIKVGTRIQEAQDAVDSYFGPEVVKEFTDKQAAEKEVRANAQEKSEQDKALSERVNIGGKIITWKEHIDDVVAKGFNQIKTKKVGFSAVLQLHNGKSFWELKKKAQQDYARQLVSDLSKGEQNPLAAIRDMISKLPKGQRAMKGYKDVLKAIPILATMKPGDYFKNGKKSDAIMPFTVEAQHLPDYFKEGVYASDPTAFMLIMEHNYEQNGDLMSDPRIDIAVYPSLGVIVPLNFTQHGFPGKYQEYIEDGKTIDEKGQNDTYKFLTLWMDNLSKQGRTIDNNLKNLNEEDNSINNPDIDSRVSHNLDEVNTQVNDTETSNTSTTPDNLVSGTDKLADTKPASLTDLFAPAGETKGRPTGNKPEGNGDSKQAPDVHPGQGSMGQSNDENVPVSEESNQASPGDNQAPEVGDSKQPGNNTGNSSLPDTGSKPDVQRDVNSLNHVIGVDDVIAPKGEVAKINANLSAIRLLNTLEKQKRNATPEEKKKLATYTGWGGLSTVLNADNAKQYEYYLQRGWGASEAVLNWAKKYYVHYQAIKKLLSEDEFSQAVTSTLTAYYTPAPIIKHAWAIAEKLGFKGGSVLDPGAGIGHFFGLAPQNLAEKSSFRGYELDSTTGRILSKLYPAGTMRVTGYENAVEGPGTIDLIMTNVPFGQTAPFDAKNKDLKGFSLHNYFIAKGIKQLKPGGIGVFITSKASMDSPASAKFREWVSTEGNADLIGAIRLPNTTFSENAGTEVTSDMLIFQKRLSSTPSPYAESFRTVSELNKTNNQNGEEVSIEVNEYYVKHPEMMLGKMVLAFQVNKGGLYSGDSETLTPNKGQDTNALLEEAIKSLPENITVSTKAVAGNKGSQVGDKEGTIIDRDDMIYEVDNGELAPVSWNNDSLVSGKKSIPYKTIAREYLNIKQLAKTLLDSEMSKDSQEADIEAIRTKLNAAYDSFIKAYGTFNRNNKLEFLEDDSEYNLVSALEDVNNIILTNKAGGVYRKYEISKSDIFTKRINYPTEEPTTAESVADALNISISYRGNLDIDYIASLIGTDKETATNKLLEEGLAFINPSSALLEDKDTYLSGYVRTKLKVAEALVEENPDYQRNVDALKKVVPKDIPGLMIKYKLGTPWIPGHIVARFIKEAIDVDCKVIYSQGTGKWLISNIGNQYNAKNQGTYATEDFKAIELIDKILNLHTPTVMKREYDPVTRQRTEKRDPEATAAAQGKMDEIADLFLNWMPNQKTEMGTLETIYNEQYNDYVEKKFSKPAFTHYPGANPDITLREHQSKAVGRILKGTTLLAHQVGTGKTYTMITAAMEMRRLGIAKKPLMVVNNSTLEQFGNDFKKLYPGAKILVPTKNQMDLKGRQKLLNKIAYGDWDAVIIPQSFLNFIPDDPIRERAYIKERIAELEEVLAEVDDGTYNNTAANDLKKAIEKEEENLVNIGKPKSKSRSVKDVAKAGAGVTTKITTQASRRKDDVVLFEKMGVDALFIDESHAYKKLGFATAQTNVKGIDTKGSQRALGLNMKVKFIHEQMGKKNVVFATGTPITNTMAELWTVLKFLSPDILKSLKIERFDDFARTFGSIEPSLEFNASGNFKIVNRFKSYINAPELLTAFRSVADVVLTEDVQEFKEGNNIPKLKDGVYTQVIMPQTESLKAQMNVFKATLAEWERLPGKQKRLLRHIPIVIFGRAKQAAIDLRLLDPSNSDDPGSKTNKVISHAMRLYHESTKYLGTQAIFSDMYQSPNYKNGSERFNLYYEVKQKLMAQGVPAHEIEIISDQKGTKLEGIFQKVRSGEIRFILGSTPRLGTGVNIQDLLKAAHHIDAPDMPMKFEQRNGRIIRQGNSHAQLNIPIEVLTYGVEKTLDATAYQRLAIKQKFINQMMKAEGLDREMNDESDNNQTDQSFDAMMSQLSGSQFAILWQQKSFDLRKLRTAKLNHERSLIEAQANLKSARQSVDTYTRILGEVKHNAEIFAKEFPKNEITSVTVGGTKAEGKEAMVKRLDVEMLKYIAYKKSTVDNAKPMQIKVNGYAAPINVTYNIGPDKFFYTHSPAGSTSSRTDIGGSFTTGGGFLISLHSQLKGYVEKIENTDEYLKQQEKNIPEYENFLTKPFDRQDKLDATAKEVAELEVKMQGENQAASKDLENVEGGSIAALEDELKDLEDDGPEDDPDDPGVKLRISDDSTGLYAEIEGLKRRIRTTVQARDAKKNELAKRLATQGSLDLFGQTKPVVTEGNMFEVGMDASEANIRRIISEYDNTLAGMLDMLKNMEQTAMTAENENKGQQILFKQTEAINNETDPIAYMEQMQANKESQKNITVRGEIEVLANKLGIKVNFAKDRTELPANVREYVDNVAPSTHRRVPGMYDEATGEIWINLAETKTAEEAIKTVLHEAVGHQGLELLLGKEGLKNILNEVYDGIDPEEVSRISSLYNTSNTNLIAEEYLAEMAEKDINPSLLDRIIAKIREIIRKLFKVDFTKNDVIVLLNKSKKNLAKQVKPKGKDFSSAGGYLDAMAAYDNYTRKPTQSGLWGNYGTDMSKIVGKDMLNIKGILTNAQTIKIINLIRTEGINNAALELAVWDITPASKIYSMLTKALGSAKAASQFLHRAGIDGMVYGKSGYVLFNSGDGTGPGSGVRTKVVNDSPLQTAAEIYEEKETKRTVSETLNGIREYIQDMNLPVRRFEEDILNRGGKQDNDSKPYRDMSLAFGRQEKLYTDYFNDKMKPVLKSVANIVKTGVSGDYTLPYIIAKHAIERNANFRERELNEYINKDRENDLTPEEIEEFEESIKNKDYSGIMPMAEPGKYTNPDELAQDIVDEFENIVPAELVNDLWNKMRTATSAILDTWEVGQRMSPEQKAEYTDKFKFFVPLRGWREGAAKELVYTKGAGFSNSLRHAEGRKSMADNPLAYILNTQFQAIGEQVDNEVKGSMLKLLMKNLANDDIHDLATIKKLYYVRIDLPDGTYEWEPTLDRPSQAMFDSGMAKTKIYNEYSKLRVPKQAREHEVMVRRSSGDIVMIFKGKSLSTAQALNKQNYMYRSILGGITDAREVNKGLAPIGHIVNFMKATMTSWNVVFPFTNFMRDAPEASLTQWIKGDSGARIIANYKESFPAIIRHMLGKPNMNIKADQLYNRFYLSGGATGYTHNKTPEEIEKDINKEVNRMVNRGTVKGEAKEVVHNIALGITKWNQVFEDATRFSVFISSLEAGKTEQDAAYDAKEASVNFNRKGKGSKAWDSIYAFFNVAFQSLQKNLKLAKDAPARFTTVAVSFMVVGYLEALMNSYMDDDDEDEQYKNINPYMRQNYLVIPNLPAYFIKGDKGGKYMSIPLPHFWRGFKSLGSIAFDISRGRMTFAQGMKTGLLNFASSLTPIDLGGFYKDGEFSLAPIVPTVIKPFAENLANRNYMGFTIAKEPFTKDQEASLAGSGLGKDNVNPAIKFFTDMLYPGDTQYKFYTDKNGNEKDVPWIRDWNPSYIEHILMGYTGGTGTLVSDIVTTVSQMVRKDQDVDFKNMPFVNRFIRETPPAKWNIIAEYYDMKEVADKHDKLIGAYRKQAEKEQGGKQIEKTENNSYYAEYQEIFDDYSKDITELKKEIDYSDTEGSQQIIDLMKQCTDQIKELNKRYN